jgi:hypothetical protein
MLRVKKNRNGQAIIGEYAVVIAMVLSAIVAMTVYFKRAVQARIYDARNYMVNEVGTRTAGEYNGDLYYGYEPYYVDSAANVQRIANDSTQLLPGTSSGTFRKDYNEAVSMRVESETLPPKNFNATTPQPARRP